MLGEFFRCRYDYPDGSRGFYIAEQGTSVVTNRDGHPRRVSRYGFLIARTFLFVSTVSHHPPISAFYYVSPANKVAVIGELRPKSKFLGNSVSTVMEGENRVYLLGRPEDRGTSARWRARSISSYSVLTD